MVQNELGTTSKVGSWTYRLAQVALLGTCGIEILLINSPGASLVAQMVKNLPVVQETWVQSLGRKDPLEKGMATHSSILAWRIPCIEELQRLQSTGLQRVGHD